jgi:magnesium transporter
MRRPAKARRRSPPGSAPGHPIESIAADIAGATVSWLQYNEAVLAEHPAIGLEDALAGVSPSAIDWIHVSATPDAAVLRGLHERLGLDPLALEDVHNGHQRTKLELYEQHSFMAISVPVLHAGELSLEQFSLFLGSDWVISFWTGDPSLVEPVRQRLRNSSSVRIRKRGADYLFYCLVDSAVDAGFPVLEILGDRIEALEEELLETPGTATISSVHEVRRRLALMRRLVLPGQEALSRLLRSDDSPLTPATRRYVHDVLDHHVRIGEIIDSLAEATRSLHELYLMTVGQRMNDVMRLLTIIATIFIPLTFIAGIYGMNFDPDASPWNMPELRTRYGYPAVMLLFASIGLGMAWMFRRRGWF